MKVDKLLFFYIPATWTFQHWIDSVLPKLAQHNLATDQDDKVPSDMYLFCELLEDRFPIVTKLYDLVGVSRDRLVIDLEAEVEAKELHYPCNAPPLHPYLWQSGQRIMGIKHRPLRERHRIVYFSRTPGVGGLAGNGGRIVLNEKELLDAIRQLISTEPKLRHMQLDIYAHSDEESIRDRVDYFSYARALIGPHGGALTNLAFAGCDTLVLELFPLTEDKLSSVGHPGLMYYIQSTMLKMNYWMVTAQCDNNETCNAVYDIGRIIGILRKNLLVDS